MNRKVIGMVGPMASGIWTIFDVLKENGYTYYRLSDRIREEALKQNIPDSRENWQKVGDSLRDKFGPDILAKLTADIVERDNHELVIIDSIRHPSEVYYLKKRFGEELFIIGLTSPVEVRFELMKIRKRGIDPMEFGEFKRLDDYEMEDSGNPKRQNIRKTLELVDLLFEHKGDLEKLKLEVAQKLLKLS